ncbi:MAG: FAD-dependent oxidoreductase [Piscirickettsiaceae bacterium]|nr:FAD-dependent oxidoreductase [Piscirickettsiaceae bacterium]
MTETTLIIGGGWSGLAAAITLIQQGHKVHLIESAKQLGGRARNVGWQGQTIDNGQHLMIGAYDHMLAIMRSIGINPTEAFHRQSIDITIYDTDYPPLNLSAKGKLPWPLSLAWNLIRSAGFSGLLQVSRLQANIPKVLSGNDITVSDWLLKTRQSDRLIKQLWEPLCLATLNTPIDHASAHTLAKVLQDSLGQHKSAADLLIPQQALGDLFPNVAAEYIKRHGGQISLQTRVQGLIVQQGKVTGINIQDGKIITADSIIIATNPSQSAKLLKSHITIDKPIEYPICTVYLQYPIDIRLPAPMLGMSGTVSQWLFDRSEQSPGLIAVVISAPGKHEKLSSNELIQQVCKEIRQVLPDLPATVEKGFVIREKRATFACTVNIENQRPKCETTIKGLWLAGDFVANSYPSTLEGAIRNGKNAAQQLLSTKNS